MNPHPPEEKPSALREQILREIDSGKVAMRPKLYFSLKVFATISVTISILILSTFLFNFILFSIRINGQDALLGFGPRGIHAFLRFFPWSLLIVDILLVALLGKLIRRFRFGYKTPTLLVLGTVFIGTMLMATFLDRGTHMNDRLFRASRQQHLPSPMNSLYRGARFAPPPVGGIHKGEILSITGSSLIVRLLDEEGRAGTTTITVLLPLNNFRATTTGLRSGDTILIAGDESDGFLRAFGIRNITSEN